MKEAHANQVVELNKRIDALLKRAQEYELQLQTQARELQESTAKLDQDEREMHMLKRQLMEEQSERAKQDLVQEKLEEQISMLEKTLEVEALKLVTSEQELSSSAQRELELKKQTSLLEDELNTRTSKFEAELASSQQVR